MCVCVSLHQPDDRHLCWISTTSRLTESAERGRAPAGYVLSGSNPPPRIHSIAASLHAHKAPINPRTRSRSQLGRREVGFVLVIWLKFAVYPASSLWKSQRAPKRVFHAFVTRIFHVKVDFTALFLPTCILHVTYV